MHPQESGVDLQAVAGVMAGAPPPGEHPLPEEEAEAGAEGGAGAGAGAGAAPFQSLRAVPNLGLKQMSPPVLTVAAGWWNLKMGNPKPAQILQLPGGVEAEGVEGAGVEEGAGAGAEAEQSLPLACLQEP